MVVKSQGPRSVPYSTTFQLWTLREITSFPWREILCVSVSSSAKQEELIPRLIMKIKL